MGDTAADRASEGEAAVQGKARLGFLGSSDGSHCVMNSPEREVEERRGAVEAGGEKERKEERI